MKENLKVMVVDDMVTQRHILTQIISDFNGIELIGSAPNGKIALAKIAFKPPDLVLLDMFMPEMDGLETLAQIKSLYPHIDVIILSSVDREMAELTMKALSAGALDFLLKPTGKTAQDGTRQLRSELSRLISLAKTRKYSRQIRGNTPAAATATAAFTPPPAAPECRPFMKSGRKVSRTEVVVIGVSTGGPNALQELIPKLSADFPVPILLVQHMPPMFTTSLASRLNQISDIRVVEANEGDIIEKGVVYIAPGGHHLVVRSVSGQKIAGLSDSPPVHSCRPAADVLFRSVAMAYNGKALAVVLTGMGSDGTSGVAAIRRKGGYAIVQDAKSSVIWGMPGSVVEAGEADEVIPLDQMASKIMNIAKEGQSLC
ncbi:MAG TPA: chemotaxis response regulator protein-glutamate methylesterase [Desulfobacteraceae bacterium]|nr:chemotaxis response regulator protein-glutamate methylesterase [Desulfobacteraceae bacterium]